MATVYVLGDPRVEREALPVALLPALEQRFPGHRFMAVASLESAHRAGGTLYVVEALEGLARAVLLRHEGALVAGLLASVHDPRLGQRLRLFKAMGWVRQTVVVGVPPSWPRVRAEEEVARLLARCLPPPAAQA